MTKRAEEPLRAAVIGLGWWGRHIVAALEGSAALRVTDAVDLDPSAGEFARERGLRLSSSLEAVLADPDIHAAILVTPHALHEEQALAVLTAGKELFCEKPLTLSVEGAQRIMALCRAQGRVLGIGHERRFEPAMEAMTSAIASGRLGRLLHLEANVSHDILARLAPGNWRASARHAPAGAWTAVGIHLSDLFLSFAGRPATVSAVTHGAEGGAAEVLCVRIAYESGVTGVINCLSATPYYGRLTAFGTHGWMEAREGGNVDEGQPTELVACDHEGRRTSTLLPATQNVRANLESWARAVRGGGAYRFSAEEILDNVRVLEAVAASAAREGTQAKP